MNRKGFTNYPVKLGDSDCKLCEGGNVDVKSRKWWLGIQSNRAKLGDFPALAVS